MEPYLTVLDAGRAEQTIERSRFIGFATPAKTVDMCDVFFDRIRREHRQATHNVPAYVLGEGCRLQWAGDDGEPRGTSGAPIVHMLVNEKISDVCVMITRYFGGIKLGTGGLVRAYTGTAKLALAAAGLGRVSEKGVLMAETDYAGYERLKTAAKEAWSIENTVFTDVVAVSLVFEPDAKDEAVRQMRAAVPGIRFSSEQTKKVLTPLAPGVMRIDE